MLRPTTGRDAGGYVGTLENSFQRPYAETSTCSQTTVLLRKKERTGRRALSLKMRGSIIFRLHLQVFISLGLAEVLLPSLSWAATTQLRLSNNTAKMMVVEPRSLHESQKQR